MYFLEVIEAFENATSASTRYPLHGIKFFLLAKAIFFSGKRGRARVCSFTRAGLQFEKYGSNGTTQQDEMNRKVPTVRAYLNKCNSAKFGR